MQRIQRSYQRDEEVAYFAPDGKRFVSVVWRGDLERNVNVYALILFDLEAKEAGPQTLLTADYTTDTLRRNQHAAPISQIRFLPDSRTVAFLGILGGQPAQVYAVDTETRQLRQLTRHPTDVRSYGLSPEGRVRIFAAMAEPDGSECRSLYRGGVSLFDRRLQPPKTATWLTRQPGRRAETFDLWQALDVVTGRRCEAYGWHFQPTREYFLVSESGATELLLDDRDDHLATRIVDGYMFIPPNLVMSPASTHAILFPSTESNPTLASRYRHFLRRETALNAASLAVIDLRTKQLRPLSAAPGDLYQQSRILWSRDGKSIVTKSLLPLDAESEAENARRAELPPQLVEIDVATGRIVTIDSGPKAEPLGIDRSDRLLVRDGNRFLGLRKQGGRWSEPSLIADLDRAGFNRRQSVSTNGTLVIGVRDGLSTPPEIAAYNPASGSLKVLTDLNPALRERAFGSIEKVSWKGAYDSPSFGYLIKPVGCVEGRRYPLVILFKDEGTPDASDDSFLIDGQDQLSGYAIQTLAGAGLVVLFTPGPPWPRAVRATPEEGPQITAHVESGIDYLDQRGLIDRARVAIAGWSRAAFWTDYALMHSRYPFRAGVHIDGGNYETFMDTFCGPARTDGPCDRSLDKLSAPRLSQQHGPLGVIGDLSLVTKLRNLGKPIDVYFYPDETHTVRTPERRRHSLTLNVDWFRFWLQDYEDPDPGKREQYRRWQEMKAGLRTTRP